MFNLISAIITILLVAIVAIAGIYFGGNAFNNNNIKGQVATYNAQAAQIDGAVKLYEDANNGAVPATIQDLVPSYLASVPVGNWAFTNDYVVNSGVSHDACLAANQSVGVSSIPTCATASPTTPCCSQ
jgi:hypothetical protein